MLPLPPAQLDPALRCPVHAACQGDDAGVAEILAARQRRLHTLGTVLGQPVQPAEPAVPARIRVTLRPDARGRLGFNLPRSHQHRPVAWCGLAHPRLQATMAALPPMPDGCGPVELRTDGQRVVLAARSLKPRFRNRLGAELRKLELPVDAVALDDRPLVGDPTITLQVAGITHRLGPGTFTQVQPDTNEALVLAVRDEARRLEATAVLDLYAGCGNLGLPLAALGMSLTGIESSPSACADARRTAAAHGLRADLRQGDAGAFRAGDAFFDLAVLDPPRAGAEGVLAQVVLTRPRGVVFVCCNPGYLARDLKPALDAGYRLVRLQAFDMFPLTEHVEVLAVLER